MKARFSERILPLDEAVASQWARFIAPLLKQGRPLPTIDSLLLATASADEPMAESLTASGAILFPGVQRYFCAVLAFAAPARSPAMTTEKFFGSRYFRNTAFTLSAGVLAMSSRSLRRRLMSSPVLA